MKKFAKILSVVLCLAMVVSFAAMAFAAEATKTQITSMDQLTSGKYVIVCANDVALGTLDTSFSKAWVVTGESVWTITVDGTNVKLADANGKYIAPVGGNANGIAEGEYSWAVSCVDGMFIFAGQGEDTVRLASNSGSENMFRAYKNSTLDGSYSSNYAYTFALYQVSDDYVPSAPETTAPEATDPVAAVKTELVAALADGDKVYIYYPNGEEALSATASGSKLAGVAATVDGDYLMVAETAAELTVSIDADGYYTFICDGKYLTSGETGNSLTFADAASDYSLWSLEAVDGGWYVKNVNAKYDNYGTVYEQYLEYYSGFTTYSLKDTSNPAYYTYQFCKAVAEEEPTPTEPVAPETTAPVAPETTAPVAPETTAPVTPETTAPVAPETTAPVAPETTAPVAPETTAPAAPETTAPAVPETTTPVAPGEDVDPTGDNTPIILAVCLMMASAAMVILVQKKRVF